MKQKVLSIILILCIGVTIFSFIKAEENRKEEENAKIIYKDFNIEEAFETYRANEVSGKNTYEDNYYKFSGIIKNFGVDVLNNPYINFEYTYSKDKYQTLQITAYFDEKDSNEIGKLKKEEKINVKCQFDSASAFYNNFYFSKCSIDTSAELNTSLKQ